MGSYRLRDKFEVLETANAALAAGLVKQLIHGEAGLYGGLNSAASGDAVTWQTKDQFVLPKLSTISILAGGRVYWNVVNGYCTYNRSANSQDFYIGRAMADALNGTTTVTVNLNIPHRDLYDFDLSRDPFQTVFVGTRAIGTLDLQDRGGSIELSLAGTNEAEKVDALGSDGFATAAGAIIEGAITVIADDNSTNATFTIGAASGTNATAFSNAAQYIGFQVKHADTHIYALSSDGTTTVAATDTTKTYAVGTRFEFWIDMRTPGACVMYVNGVQVLSATTFGVSAATAAWKLLAHLVKTSSTDTMDVQVEWLKCRLQQQSP